MKLKHQYTFGLVGLVFAAFGGGMLFMSAVIGIPSVTTINASAIIMLGLGLAILIKFLSTIKTINIEVTED